MKIMQSIQHSILLSICLTVLFASFVGAQKKQSSDLFRIIVDGKYGFIDLTGKVVVEPNFESVGKFSEGLAPVYFRNNQAAEKNSTGFINDKGEFAIKPISGSADEFSDDVSIIGFDVRAIPDSSPDGKFGAIDKSGKIIIEPNFVRTFPFKNGLGYAVSNDGKEGFINKTGKIIWQYPK